MQLVIRDNFPKSFHQNLLSSLWSPRHSMRSRSASPVSGWEVDVKRQSFPLCVVWCPIPVITHLFPVIGHLGICDSDGCVFDFLGPRFIHRGSLGFGDVARFWRLDPKQWVSMVHLGDAEKTSSSSSSASTTTDSSGIALHDLALRRSIRFFEQHENYNLFGNNCHQFVAHAMNVGGFGGKVDWNMVHLAVLVLVKGQWTSGWAFLKTWGLFIVVATVLIVFQWQIVIGFLAAFVALAAWFAYYSFRIANPTRKVFQTLNVAVGSTREMDVTGGEGRSSWRTP